MQPGGNSAITYDDKICVNIYKAPPSGQGSRMYTLGLRASDYSGGPGQVPDGLAYFAKDRSIAEKFAHHYKEGIAELRYRPRNTKPCGAQYERLYESRPRVELAIPREVVEQLNRYERA